MGRRLWYRALVDERREAHCAICELGHCRLGACHVAFAGIACVYGISLFKLKMTTVARFLFSPLLAIWLMFHGGPSFAAPAERWVFGLAPSYAYLVLDNQGQPRGMGGSAFLHYGITTALAFRLSGLWTVHEFEGTTEQKEPKDTSQQVINIGLGIHYAFDIVPLSPAIEMGIGILHQRRGEISATDLGLQLGLSADYWVLRWLAVGAAFHYHAFLSNPTKYPVFFDTGPRVAVRW